MNVDLPTRILARLVSLRVPIVILFALLVPLAAYRATHISSENGLERLIQPDDPDYVATRAFQKIFPDKPSVLLIFEAADPWSAQTISQVDAATKELRTVPHIGAFSVLDAVRRSRPGAPIAELKQLALGTPFFQKQGLLGADYLSIDVDLDVTNAADRNTALAAIDQALARAHTGHVRRVGSPYASAWIEDQSGHASGRYFPFFGALVVIATLFLYRSFRTLAAFLLTLASAVALGVAAGGLLGYTFTIVSVLVPLTVMVTSLASLVYLHSVYVEKPAGIPVREHQLAALRNKLLPVTASMLAAALGFAALSVSKIRPLREMGLWTASGLAIAWVVSLTLFPALQLMFKTPTHEPQATGARKPDLYDRLAQALPEFTRAHRKLIVGAALLLSLLGGFALFGFPGVVKPMSVGTDTVSYIDPALPLRQDLEWFRVHVGDLNVAHVWIKLPKATATEPETLRAIDQLQTALDATPRVIQTIGPTTFLRLRRYFSGQGETLPGDPAQLKSASEDLEQLLLTEPGLRGYIDVAGLTDLNLTVIFKEGDAKGYAEMSRQIQSAVASLHAAPLEGATVQVVGESLLQTKVGASLVPTLAESFLITAALIFVVFLFVFRSGTARLIAMLPSIFAILATFLGMRIFGAPLNVATILIATTVLGTTETDQVHFFHHLHERDDAPLGEALLHAFRVSGRAIVFATLINAVGFLGLSFSTFPPLRQFGLVTSAAFVLALIADFTALPAGLWLVEKLRNRHLTAAAKKS